MMTREQAMAAGLGLAMAAVLALSGPANAGQQLRKNAPRIEACVFSGNGGGAIYYGRQCTANLVDCAFSQNTEAFEEGRKLSAQSGAEAPADARDWHGTDLTKASPEEMEAVLADTVLKEFKVRLGRIGIEYQTPAVQ